MIVGKVGASGRDKSGVATLAPSAAVLGLLPAFIYGAMPGEDTREIFSIALPARRGAVRHGGTIYGRRRLAADKVRVVTSPFSSAIYRGAASRRGRTTYRNVCRSCSRRDTVSRNCLNRRRYRPFLLQRVARSRTTRSTPLRQIFRGEEHWVG